MKKRIIFITILSLFVLGLFISNIFASNKSIIKITACPTYYYELLDQLDPKKYELFFSESTSRSIIFLKNNIVDVIISGRTLKPGEINAQSLVLGKGYSFLSNSEKTIFIEELKNYDIYTDFEVDKIKNLFPVMNISQVEDVYQYMDEGIIITSWENTDYNRAEIIHLLENNGRRVKLSRQATAYYKDESINLEYLKTLTF